MKKTRETRIRMSLARGGQMIAFLGLLTEKPLFVHEICNKIKIRRQNLTRTFQTLSSLGVPIRRTQVKTQQTSIYYLESQKEEAFVKLLTNLKLNHMEAYRLRKAIVG